MIADFYVATVPTAIFVVSSSADLGPHKPVPLWSSIAPVTWKIEVGQLSEKVQGIASEDLVQIGNSDNLRTPMSAGS